MKKLLRRTERRLKFKTARAVVLRGAPLLIPRDFEKPGFGEQSIKVLDDTFAQGAVAVKIYKSIGMELRNTMGPI